MGLDCGIVVGKNAAEMEENYRERLYYDDIKDNDYFYEYDEFIYPNNCEIVYWRKFWSILENDPKIYKAIQKSDSYYIRLNKEQIKRMIDFHAYHDDYFDGFSQLPKLCMLYRDYDKIIAKGLKMWLYASY